MRETEKQMINYKSEKEDLSRDLCEAQEKLKLQSSREIVNRETYQSRK